MGGIPWVIMSEVICSFTGYANFDRKFITSPHLDNHFFYQIFPINVKGSAGSFVTFVHWLCSWIVSYAFNFLMSWNSAGRFSFTFDPSRRKQKIRKDKHKNE
jgi:hypothetical protein